MHLRSSVTGNFSSRGSSFSQHAGRIGVYLQPPTEVGTGHDNVDRKRENSK